MDYKIFEPSEKLKPYVKYFWTLNTDDVSAKRFRTFADYAPGLIIQPTENGQMFQSGKALPATFIFGQTTAPTELTVKGKFSTVAACFHPNALRSMFSISTTELTDSCLDIGLLSKAVKLHLNDKLLFGSIESRTAILDKCLVTLVSEQKGELDTAMQRAYTWIITSSGKCSLKSLREEIGISERSFERRFKSYTGMSPKLFSRICRFQKSLKDLRTHRQTKLTGVALENAYADQSHFIRNLKEFSGISPKHLQNSSIEIIDSLNEVFL